MNNREFAFRDARESYIPDLVNLENDIWGVEGADKIKIQSRINVFPRGSIIAELNGCILGYQSFQYVNERRDDFTWKQITDDGTIVRSHTMEGEYGYGINLTIARKAQCTKLGEALSLVAVSRVIEDNKKGSMLGSRIPGFRRYLKKHPQITADEYARLSWKGKPRDSELKLYGELGFELVRILPNYFPDPESLNYGALLFLPNDFYAKEYRFFISEELRKEAKNLIKMEGKSWE